jgi:hypothetical protein
MPHTFVFKRISAASIPEALKKADRYRLLGEPDEAESVCLDILQVDPGNQEALISLILALSDQFKSERRPRVEVAQRYVAALTDEYQRRYYRAVVLERDAMAQFGRDTPPVIVFLRFCEAMDAYEAAAAVQPPGEDSPALRWNACLRAIRRRQLKPGLEETYESA